MIFRSLMLVTLLCASGCGTMTLHHVMTGEAHAPTRGEVRLVMESAPVPDGFQEVAIVQAVGNGTKAKLEVLASGLKQEAQKLGCNAVVRVRVDQGSSHATAVGVAGILP